ncbi:MAG: hypothetical protein Q7U04_08635, partial [Bacteriovorax sp.]|nr:hypothetical protein [Bacteriovorax sp.]
MKRFYSTKFLLTLVSFTMLIDPLAQAASTLECSGYPPGSERSYCLNMQVSIAGAEAGVDCVNCNEARQQETSWKDVAVAAMQPLAFFGASYFSSKYQYKTAEAYANSYASGQKECTNRFNSFLDYSSSLGANPVLIDQAQPGISSCNGSGMGQFAGYGGYSGNGYGGFGNPNQSAGYSSGFLGGMMGPYYGSGYGAGVQIGGAGYGQGGGFGMGLGMGLGNGLAGMMGYGMPGMGMGIGGSLNIGIGGGGGMGGLNGGGYNPYGGMGGLNGGGYNPYGNIGGNMGGNYNPYGNMNGGFNPYGGGGIGLNAQIGMNGPGMNYPGGLGLGGGGSICFICVNGGVGMNGGGGGG